MDIQKTVLVVDDSTTNRSILCDILHSDYSVIQAENGIQALTKLKKQDKKVDAIIPVSYTHLTLPTNSRV